MMALRPPWSGRCAVRLEQDFMSVPFRKDASWTRGLSVGASHGLLIGAACGVACLGASR